MKKIKNTKRTRFQVSLYFSIGIFCLAVLAVFQDMEGLASACIANIMIILGAYIFGETKRPSNPITKGNIDNKEIIEEP